MDEIVKKIKKIFHIDLLTNTFKVDFFPFCLKKADITPIYKKNSRTSKDNYRLVNILPNILKILERPLINQISYFLIKSFSFISADLEKVLVPNTT